MKAKPLNTVLITISIVLSICFFSTAQTPSWQWAQSGAGNDLDYSRSVATDYDGNVYVTGNYNSPSITFDTTTVFNTAGWDLYVIKYSPSGNVIWVKTTAGVFFSHCIAADPNGNVLVTGSFQSHTVTFGSITLINDSVGFDEVFIVKYDSAGNVLWAKSAGGKNTDRGIGITADVNSNVLVTGNFQSNSITFDSITLVNAGPPTYSDLFLVKYDSMGNFIWAKRAGNTGNESSDKVATDSVGNIFITGVFTSSTLVFDTTTLINLGQGDIFVAKYNPLGVSLWAKSAGGNEYDGATSITTDRNGNVLATGLFYSPSISFGTTVITKTGPLINSNMFIVKYDSIGNVLWAKNAGGNSSDGGVSLATDGYNNAFVTGFFYSDSITFGNYTLINNSNGGYNDSYIVKYDSAGSVIWALNFGSIDHDESLSIATDIFGNVLVCGDFFSPTIEFGSVTLINASINSGDPDMFVAKLNTTTGLPEDFNSSYNLNIYPNPTTNTFTLQNNFLGAQSSLQIVNAIGEVVYSQKLFGKKECTIKPNLKAGFYFVKVTDDQKQLTSKLIIQ